MPSHTDNAAAVWAKFTSPQAQEKIRLLKKVERTPGIRFVPLTGDAFVVERVVQGLMKDRYLTTAREDVALLAGPKMYLTEKGLEHLRLYRLFLADLGGRAGRASGKCSAKSKRVCVRPGTRDTRPVTRTRRTVGRSTGSSKLPMFVERKDRLFVPEPWKKAALDAALLAVERAYGAQEASLPAVRSTIERRIGRIAQLVHMFKSKKDFTPEAEVVGPFSPVDAAAMVLSKRRTAVKIARYFFGQPFAELHFGEGSNINMDWFDFDLSEVERAAGRRGKATGRARGGSAKKRVGKRGARDEFLTKSIAPYQAKVAAVLASKHGYSSAETKKIVKDYAMEIRASMWRKESPSSLAKSLNHTLKMKAAGVWK